MIVLITGASSGIGKALARHYLRQGATVAGIARRVDRLEALRAEAGSAMVVFPGDVTDRRAMAGIVADIELKLGPIDVAIACAGIAEEQSAADLDLAAVERALDTNVRGTFNVLVPAAAAMRARGHGQVVAISSLAAELSLPRITAYCMSKAALNSAMQGLELMLWGSGVAVTTICPGFIATEMTAGRVPPGRCLSLDRALCRIARAIESKRRGCHFPVTHFVLLRLLGLLPFRVRRIACGIMSHLLYPLQSGSLEVSP